MIKFSGTALIHYISPIIQVSENFQKRELILDASWEKDGKRYPNFVLVEFTGDKMAQLDGFRAGMRVTVDGVLQGREYKERIYNTVKGHTVTYFQPQAQAPKPAPMPNAAPQQAPYPQQSQYPQQAPYPQQPYGQPPLPGASDLPFSR